MKNIFKEMGDTLHRKCDSLTQTQRRRLLIILSVIYLLLTAIVLTSIFIPESNNKEKENFNDLMDSAIQQDSLELPALTDKDIVPSNDNEYE